jgi:hypothetical protein
MSFLRKLADERSPGSGETFEINERGKRKAYLLRDRVFLYVHVALYDAPRSYIKIRDDGARNVRPALSPHMNFHSVIFTAAVYFAINITPEQMESLGRALSLLSGERAAKE